MDEYFAKGKRGLVFLRKEKSKVLLVKKKNPKSDVDTLENEAKFNKLLSKKGIGPKFISYNSEELVREFIEGEELRKWLPLANKQQLKKFFKEILDQCRKLDLLKINKQEMTNPYKNIIITPEDEAVMIDFERCRETNHPKNVTQFIQFINSKNIRALFEEKNYVVNHDSLRKLAKEYKDSYSNIDEQDKIFKRIINNL